VLKGSESSLWPPLSRDTTRGRRSVDTDPVLRGVILPEFEAEADYVGLYMMARAALPIDRAPSSGAGWAGLSGVQQSGVCSSHPETPTHAGLEASVDEIRSKIDKGLPLVPEKDSLAFSTRSATGAAAPAPPCTPRTTSLFPAAAPFDRNMRWRTGRSRRDPLDFEDTVSKCLVRR